MNRREQSIDCTQASDGDEDLSVGRERFAAAIMLVMIVMRCLDSSVQKRSDDIT